MIREFFHKDSVVKLVLYQELHSLFCCEIHSARITFCNRYIYVFFLPEVRWQIESILKLWKGAKLIDICL